MCATNLISSDEKMGVCGEHMIRQVLTIGESGHMLTIGESGHINLATFCKCEVIFKYKVKKRLQPLKPNNKNVTQ